jgi:hypothetical protein
VRVDDKRRSALVALGRLTLGAAGVAASSTRAVAAERIIPPGASDLADLTARLRQAPRRRDFKSVPMTLSHPDFWDDVDTAPGRAPTTAK